MEPKKNYIDEHGNYMNVQNFTLTQIYDSGVEEGYRIAKQETQECSNCKKFVSPYFEIKFDEEQMNELVDKAKAEVLASIERPHGEWNFIQSGMCVCSFCGATPHTFYKNYCAKCGADMRGKKE